jgi:oxalate decarboxylase/phosphoglucose isomerase-like protein (cupin superfamily)
MLNIIQWKTVLKECEVDHHVGFKIKRISGDDKSGTYVCLLDIEQVTPLHYHKKHEEEYHIVHGIGTVYLQNISTNQEIVTNLEEQASFMVSPSIVHQLTNTGKEPLIFLLTCPLSHLRDQQYFLPKH